MASPDPTPVVLLGKASQFALAAHGDQRYGRKPYHAHLLDVVQALKRFVEWEDLTQPLVDAAWLHDVVEDTDVPLARISDEFGARTAELVDAVTKDVAGPRAVVWPPVAAKIRATPQAILIKLADRIANLEQCVSWGRLGRKPGRLFRMYVRERAAFEHELRGRCAGESGAAELMWQHIDCLYAAGQNSGKEPA